MKKTILFATLALLIASPSFAVVSTISPASPVTLGSTSFATSTKVTLMFESTTTAYTCAAKHEQGDIKFSSSSASATITDNTCAKGTIITTTGTACP